MFYRRAAFRQSGAERRAGVRRTVILAAVGAALVVAVGVYLGARPHGVAAAQKVGDISILFISLGAALACTRAALRRGSAARGWALLAVGLGVWALGQAVWTVHGLNRGHVYPFPSLADVGFLGYAVPAFAGLLYLTRAAGRLGSPARLILDILVIALGALLISWQVVLHAIVEAGGLDTLAGLTGLAYPVVDVVMFSTVLALGMRQLPGKRLAWTLLGGGLLTLAVTDSIYVRLVFEGQTAVTASPLTLGWMLAFLLIALAAGLPERSSGARPGVASTVVAELLPYVPVIGAALLLGLGALEHYPLLLLVAVLLVAAVLVRQLQVVTENVTLSAELEEKVAERTAELNRLGSIVTSSSDAIIGVSLDGVITSWNPAAERLYGHRSVDVVDRAPEFLPPANVEYLRGLLDDARAGRESEVYVTDWPAKDGSTVPVEIRASLVRDGDIVRGLAIFGQDITERRREATALEDAREQALESSRLKSEFLATMSHEIRTPMNGVIGLTGLLLETPLTDVQRQYAEGVHSAGDALLTVINDILDFSKLEAGKVELEVVDFDPRRMMEELGALLAPTAHSKRLELLVYTVPEVPGALRGDIGRIRQVLLNLASNAVKFTSHGEVAIKASCSAGEDGRSLVRFEVSDTGIGIAPEDRERLFDAFSQADASTTRRFGGTGLGLAISLRLVEAMGGHIALDSEAGVGSTFSFEIPLPVGSRLDTTNGSRDLVANLRALVVDDNATNRLILESQLSAWRLHTDLAEDAESAIAQMRSMAAAGRPYDVALLDMCMPDVDGLQLARLISADASLRDTRLMLLTSAFPMAADEMREAGIGEWLNKPVRSSDLLDKLMRLTSAVPEVRLEPSSPRAPRSPVSASLGRVLVVEDNLLNQLVAEGVVSKLGYEVHIVPNGLDALRAIERTSYAAVLMDCHMPVMDGFEATREIRRREGADGRIPIIAMTAGAMDEDRDRCLDAGMDDFVSKPFDVATLSIALAKWVTPEHAHSEPGLPSDDLIPSAEASPIDPARVAALLELGSVGDSTLLAVLAEGFFRNAVRIMAAIREAVRAGGHEELRLAAHELNGSSSNLGATRVAALCRELETGGRSADSARTDRLLEQLEVELVSANAALLLAVSDAS